MHFIDIIILLVLIVVIYSRLKDVLGTKPEVKKTEISEQTAAKIFDIIVKEAEKNIAEENPQTINKGEIIPNDVDNMSELDKTLSKIPNFDREKFISNSKRAFEMILASFSEGDTESLKELLSPALYKKFVSVIESRKKDGVIAETELIGFEKAEIEDAQIARGSIAKIIVKFVSEQVNILKNSKDEVIEGDANFIQNITDIWTFEKNMNSTSPKWLLASTKK